MIRSVHFWVVMALLIATAATLQVRGDSDRVPPSIPLDQFPRTINGWNSTDQPLSEETLDVLGKGVFLSRVYTPPGITDASDPQAIGLFIAYFPTQRTGQSIHSPQNCLPGAGWTFVSSGTVDLPNPGGPPHQVGDYLISDGTHQAEVLYWYKTEKYWIANDWVAKGYMLLDSMRYVRTDAALVRVTLMMRPGESREMARQRVVGFANAIAPLIPSYVPD
jgi:EpsI family protein